MKFGAGAALSGLVGATAAFAAAAGINVAVGQNEIPEKEIPSADGSILSQPDYGSR